MHNKEILDMIKYVLMTLLVTKSNGGRLCIRKRKKVALNLIRMVCRNGEVDWWFKI